MEWLKVMGVIMLLLSTKANAADNIYTGWFSNKAASGYDTVSFFTQGKAVKGRSEFSYHFQGVDWLFSSDAHRQLFKNNPNKYAPQYGGFCAWAIGEKQSRAPGDPKYWHIVNDKLYFNYDKTVQNVWLKDVSRFIRLADKNWPAMRK